MVFQCNCVNILNIQQFYNGVASLNNLIYIHTYIIYIIQFLSFDELFILSFDYSDLQGIKTNAKKDGSDWILNGSKVCREGLL